MEYKLYQSKLVKKNHNVFVNNCIKLNKYITHFLNTDDPTWSYSKYNIFILTSSSVLFYKLFKELNSYIRDFVGHSNPLWMHSWLNYHETPKKLSKILGKEQGYHGHASKYHGYISIDPQDTTTIFKNKLQINNKIGQIYIGPGNFLLKDNFDFDHCVIENSPITKPRITIGFNFHEEYNQLLSPCNIPLL